MTVYDEKNIHLTKIYFMPQVSILCAFGNEYVRLSELNSDVRSFYSFFPTLPNPDSLILRIKGLGVGIPGTVNECLNFKEAVGKIP